MSTRSGKRIHSSLGNNEIPDNERAGLKSERKTRSKRKDNSDESNTVLNETAHYVRYPGDEAINDNNVAKSTRKLRRHTLKEQNVCLTITKNSDDNVDTQQCKLTRRTKRLIQETMPNSDENNQPVEKEGMEYSKQKGKKNKKKKSNNIEEVENCEEAIKENVPKGKKKSKKKKHLKQPGLLIVENVIKENLKNATQKKSNVSIDSFHSAAGSPEKIEPYETVCMTKIVASNEDNIDASYLTNRKLVTPNISKRNSSTIVKDSNDKILTDTFDEGSANKKQSNRNKNSLNRLSDTRFIDTSDNANSKKLDRTFNTSNTKINAVPETSTEKLNGTFDKNCEMDIISTKSDNKLDSSFDRPNSELDSNKIKLVETVDKYSENKSNSICKNTNKLESPQLSGIKRKSLNASYCKQSLNSTFNKISDDLELKKSISLDTTFDKLESPKVSGSKSKSFNASYCIPSLNSTFDKISDLELKKRKSLDTTFDKLESPQVSGSKRKSLNASHCKQSLNSTFDKISDDLKLNKTKSLDTTFDKESIEESNSVDDKVQINSHEKPDCINLTFDKFTNDSHISINSDGSKMENIINITPELVESSMEKSNIYLISEQHVSAENVKEIPITPLKREGTYTKDSPKVETPNPKEPTTPKSRDTRLSINRTPDRRKSLPSPGRTPFPAAKSCEKKINVLNLSYSIEKPVPRTSLAEPVPRMTRVMFCSPVNSTGSLCVKQSSQIKRKVIKSNLKGSNKSFVFDESSSETRQPASRKRSYTHSDADSTQSKRSRLAEEMQQSVDRLSRPRTVSATAKLPEPSTPSTSKTPTKARPKVNVSRTKLPNFAALHQKRFDKMESLDECQERKAKRARQLLTPTGSLNLIERVSPKEKAAESPKTSQPREAKKHTLESLAPGYTRFGFKMNCVVGNPFSDTRKQNDTSKDRPNALKRQATLPSLAGTTSLRREAAKHTVMREKSFTEKRNTKRKENRTVIKGVRTNRRFELQMQMRNIN